MKWRIKMFLSAEWPFDEREVRFIQLEKIEKGYT